MADGRPPPAGDCRPSALAVTITAADELAAVENVRAAYSRDEYERRLIASVVDEAAGTARSQSQSQSQHDGDQAPSASADGVGDDTVHTNARAATVGGGGDVDEDSRLRHGEATPFDILAEHGQQATSSGSAAAASTVLDRLWRSKRPEAASKRKRCSHAEAGPSNHSGGSDAEFVPSAGSSHDDDEHVSDADDGAASHGGRPKAPRLSRTKRGAQRVDGALQRCRDDGSEKAYLKRLKLLRKKSAYEQLKRIESNQAHADPSANMTVSVEGRLSCDKQLWDKLFPYQRTGVRWLWQLHEKQLGGVVGDEMGLGKTVQLIAFLAALAQSKLRSDAFPKFVGLGPVLLVAPATLLQQWVAELHQWAPDFRVAVLHASGTHRGDKPALVGSIATRGGILVTSYATLVQMRERLVEFDWHYVILDEGHIIRNPNAKAALAAKAFTTPHRLILTGSPMQNNLRELWSIVDFVYPGLLGSSQVFMEELGIPITQGGYANASAVQVATAYKCACVLRDAIAPYMLRRMKDDVQDAVRLPGKSEQVLFCALTGRQRELYEEYLRSRECDRILSGGVDAFAGLTLLRKLCNHADLLDGGPDKYGQSDACKSADEDDSRFGHYSRSGKMIVVRSLLRLWHKQGHRVLLFSQSRRMLAILQTSVAECGYTFLRMDGSTPVSQRQALVRRFNDEPRVFVFLLTTRVGGLGVSLTGADRVLIFDPDWNPSTDVQARERAWRIGQHRPVTIYRLMTSGTIEEKIYHRQIFKQFLSNRILKEPRQRRFFKTNDLHELFTLGDARSDRRLGTETAAIFAGAAGAVRPKAKRRRRAEHTKKGRENYFDALADAGGANWSRAHDDADVHAHGADAESSVPTAGELDEKTRRKLSSLARKLGGKSRSVKAAESNSACAPAGALFEGDVRLPNLVSTEPFSDTAVDATDCSRTDDDYVLRKLFKKTGVHEALRHDAIESSSAGADVDLVHREAARVATEAARRIARSRRTVLTAAPARRFGPTVVHEPKPIVVQPSTAQADRRRSGSSSKLSEPLFTEFSVFGRPEADREPAVARPSKAATSPGALKSTGTAVQQEPSSSTQLLAMIRGRQQRHQVADAEHREQSDDNADADGGDQCGIDDGAPFDASASLADELRSFVALAGDGRVTTGQVLRRFGGGKVHASAAPVFRAVLRRLCHFSKVDGEGVWTLKREYR